MVILLTLGRLSYFLDGCFLDGCFLDGLLVNLLTLSKSKNNLTTKLPWEKLDA